MIHSDIFIEEKDFSIDFDSWRKDLKDERAKTKACVCSEAKAVARNNVKPFLKRVFKENSRKARRQLVAESPRNLFSENCLEYFLKVEF